MNILIVKLGSIGDIVHTLPALAAIRHELPHARVVWAAERRSAEILRDHPMIDELIEIDTRGLRNLRRIEDSLPAAASQIRQLRKFKFDVALDFQGLMKSGLVAKLSGAKERWGFSGKDLREPASRVFLTNIARVVEGCHIIQKNLELVRKSLSIPVPTADFEFPIKTGPADKAEANQIASAAGPRFLILNPAGGWVTKLWPPENFAHLADALWNRMGIRAVVVTGPNEGEVAAAVRRASNSGSIIFSQPSLKGFYELARLASLYVGGDTGPTHIAVAAGTPVVGLFGPTEWWRNGSPNPEDICVERLDIECRVNCHRRKCSNWICMNSDVDTVYNACERRLIREQVAA